MTLAAKSDSILLTGGEGFIGRHVRAAVAGSGRHVLSLDRKLGSPREGEECCGCDITDAARINDIFSSHRITGIIHLASLLRTASETNPYAATQVNVVGSLNMLEAARSFAVPRFVYASSVSIYGSKPALEKVRETDPTAPEDVYGTTKKYVEALGEVYRRKYGIQFVALRVPIVVGAGAAETASPWRTELLASPGKSSGRAIFIPFRETETLSIVHAEDLARQLLILLDAKSPSWPVYNAACEVWSLSDLKKEVEALNKTAHIHFGDSAISGFPRMIDADRLKAEFSYSPTPLKDHLRRLAQRQADQRPVTHGT